MKERTVKKELLKRNWKRGTQNWDKRRKLKKFSA